MIAECVAQMLTVTCLSAFISASCWLKGLQEATMPSCGSQKTKPW